MGKIFGFDKHSVYGWIGHAEHIQDEHYLQMMDDDHVVIMSNLSARQINPSGTGSYLSEMLFIALNRNLPERVEAATEHALGITKIRKSKIFDTPAVRATPVWSPPRDIFKSSGGGTYPICERPSHHRAELPGVQETVEEKVLGPQASTTVEFGIELLDWIWDKLDEAERSELTLLLVDFREADMWPSWQRSGPISRLQRQSSIGLSAGGLSNVKSYTTRDGCASTAGYRHADLSDLLQGLRHVEGNGV